MMTIFFHANYCRFELKHHFAESRCDSLPYYKLTDRIPLSTAARRPSTAMEFIYLAGALSIGLHTDKQQCDGEISAIE